MKFVHIADMHFDTPFRILSDRADLGEIRRLDQRKALKKEAPPSMRETMRVIEGFRKRQFIQTWINRALRNNVNDLEREMINSIEGPCSDLIAYRLGVIRGKRIERAKRKH